MERSQMNSSRNLDLDLDSIMAEIDQDEVDLLAAEIIGLRILFALTTLTATLGFNPDLELLSQQVREDEGNDAWADHEDLVHWEGRRIARRIVVSIMRGLMSIHELGFVPDAAWTRASESVMACIRVLDMPRDQYTWRQRRKALSHAHTARAAWLAIIAHRR